MLIYSDFIFPTHNAYTIDQSEFRADKIKDAIEQEAERERVENRSPPRVEITESETPTGEAFDYEDDEETTDGPAEIPNDTEPEAEPETGKGTACVEEVLEEEISESVTEIEEIFQVSEDGVNWKTVKKITTITPRGTTEKIVVLGGISCTWLLIV